jgi:hypothetical protein
MVVPTAHAFLVRGRVFEPKPQQPALVAALQARQRRGEARAIAARDVDLARELRIGRPDLPRQFDDGGLVDLNHVPTPVIVQLLGLSEADAAQVIEARDRIGGFLSAEEVIAHTDLSPTRTAFASGWCFSPDGRHPPVTRSPVIETRELVAAAPAP